MFQHTREQGTFSCCSDHLSCHAHFFEYAAERLATSVVLKNEVDVAAEDYSTMQSSLTRCSSDPTATMCHFHAVAVRLEALNEESGVQWQGAASCLSSCVSGDDIRN